jgi:hypothetical protein
LEEKWEIFKKALPSPYRVGVLVRKNYLVSIRFTLWVSFLVFDWINKLNIFYDEDYL